MLFYCLFLVLLSNFLAISNGEAISRNIEVESVVILDEEYVANMRARGHATNTSLIELMELKWAGVQAEWSRLNNLKYNVTFSIKEIVIWESNPIWYTPSYRLQDTVYSICRGAQTHRLWTHFDHIHLFTGRKPTDAAGYSYVGDVCKEGRKCSVSTDTRIEEYVITAHELGHQLGMAHDNDVGCPRPHDGIMGSKTAGWSTCSVAAMNLTLQTSSAGCVKSTNVIKANVINLQKLWPGLLYTRDELCELQHGAGFRLTSPKTACSGYTCMNMDPSSRLFGVSYPNPTPTDGSYCGEHKVCSSQIVNDSYHCISWNDTGLDQALFTTVAGGWSPWGMLTSCSRTCGTGIQYRQRFCNNPKPRNSAWCDGDEFYSQVCNTQPCHGDSTSESALIKQRASETCAHWKTSDLYHVVGNVSANYLNTGNKYGESGDNQCIVRCDTVKGHTSRNEIHGIMPDGTPCAHETLSLFVERNHLPRRSGMYGRCVQGKCQLFGCDGKTGTLSNDGCGVCGGNNSSCQIVEGLFNATLAHRERRTVAILPANASSIQFYFKYTSMQYHFLEVNTKDSNIAVIKYNAPNTMANPVDFAGTQWYLLANQQFLYAYGPTNQEVHILLFNFDTHNNTGVIYGYSLPNAAERAVCTGTCANNGKWNSATCSCHCSSGFYGINCTERCPKFCQNSQPHTASCNCDCRGNTYGDTCNCKYPFTGIDCQDCKINSCQNGGTFNATACRCSCPPGYGDLDCSAPCRDASRHTAFCLSKVAQGHCDSRNENMERDCYMSCGLCAAASNSTIAATPPITNTVSAKP